MAQGVNKLRHVSILDNMNNMKEVKPLTEELIAQGKTIKCTKCHAWVGGKYRTRGDYTCHTCRGDGYITEALRQEIRDFNAMHKRQVAVERELLKGVKAVLAHSPHRKDMEYQVPRMARVVMLSEGWDVPHPQRSEGNREEWAEWFRNQVEELTGWNFVEWFHSDEF